MSETTAIGEPPPHSSIFSSRSRMLARVEQRRQNTGQRAQQSEDQAFAHNNRVFVEDEQHFFVVELVFEVFVGFWRCLGCLFGLCFTHRLILTGKWRWYGVIA